MAGQPVTPYAPQSFTLDVAFSWTGVENVVMVGGTFAGQEIIIQFQDKDDNWVDSAVAGDPGYFDVAKAAAVTGSPGINARFHANVGVIGALTLSIADEPDNSNTGARKLKHVA